MFLELPNKQLLKLVNMPTEIGVEEKEILDLWISRINAAVRELGLTYSRLLIC